MLVFPNAKINLGLNVTSRRPDGYHELMTVMVPVQACDILEVSQLVNLEKEEKNEFIFSGLAVNFKGKSSVEKAYDCLSRRHKLPACRMHLHKQIPVGAGLGGGSADGAFALKALNDLFQLNASEEELEKMAGELGSDDPFFVRNQPALCTGRGEIMESIPALNQTFWCLLLNPGIHVNTALAYQGINPKEKQKDDFLEVYMAGPYHWRNQLTNDFEDGVFEKFPAIKELKSKCYEAGAVYASMSGSGSTVFALFPENNKPQAAKFNAEWSHCSILRL